MRVIYFAYFLFCCLLVSSLLAPSARTDEGNTEQLPEAKSDVSRALHGDSEQSTGNFGELDLSELSEADKRYLGLKVDAKPILRNVDADLIIVEFLSIYCPSCQAQAPIFNQLHSAIGDDPMLESRVKMLGIGLGNNSREVTYFRKEKKIPFPMLTDPKFVIYDRLTNSTRTPYTVILRRDGAGNLIMADSHLGLIRPYNPYLDEIKAVMKYDDDMLKLKQQEALSDNIVERKELRLSKEELMAKVRDIMTMVSKDKDINIIAKSVSLPDSPEVYEGCSEHGRYFAVVVNKSSVCDICHGAQFIYVIDETGKVVHFESIYLTKRGNKVWDEGDIEKTRKRIVGKSVLQPMSFDPEVDAVTSATITSAILFRAIADGKKILRLMEQ